MFLIDGLIGIAFIVAVLHLILTISGISKRAGKPAEHYLDISLACLLLIPLITGYASTSERISVLSANIFITISTASVTIGVFLLSKGLRRATFESRKREATERASGQ